MLPVYAKYFVPSPPPNQVTFANAMEGRTGKDVIMSELYVSHMGTPTRNSTHVTAPVPNPLPGEWNLLYYITADTDTNYTITTPAVFSCPNDTAGDNTSCLYPLTAVTTSIANPAAVAGNIPLQAGWWNYYTVSVIAPEPFWVSVYTPNLSDFDLYVRMGSVPDDKPGSYDIKNCNVYGSCGYATIINLNNTAAALPSGHLNTYYVGIHANTNITYTIWWSSTCAPLCVSNEEESGVCSFSGNVGQCSCEDGYMGFDCATPNGTLPTQYIVLIIIASLVVLSALIGFFAWAYMQRKREGYSSLS